MLQTLVFSPRQVFSSINKERVARRNQLLRGALTPPTDLVTFVDIRSDRVDPQRHAIIACRLRLRSFETAMISESGRLPLPVDDVAANLGVLRERQVEGKRQFSSTSKNK